MTVSEGLRMKVRTPCNVILKEPCGVIFILNRAPEESNKALLIGILYLMILRIDLRSPFVVKILTH